MSEYQYYEFQTVDRVLTDDEMCELREYSSRANITSHSFTNEYSWGNFKGDENEWMEKYFDGFLYFANWGTHNLKLRVSSELLDIETVHPYLMEDVFSAWECDGNTILDFMPNAEDFDGWEESYHLSSFLSLRSDLSHGDLRSLYLGWLSGLYVYDYDEDSLEPPVPPGLSNLSPALQNFADFLYLDKDLIEVASRTSPTLQASTLNSKDIRSLLARLPANEKEDLLADLIEGTLKRDLTVANKLTARLNMMRQSQHTTSEEMPKQRRTIAQLMKETEKLTETKNQLRAERYAAEKAEKQRQNLLEREKQLDEIVGRETVIWNIIESLVSETKPKSYDKAIELLVDLRDLAARENSTDFSLKLNAMMNRHSKKYSFLKRLTSAKHALLEK